MLPLSSQVAAIPDETVVIAIFLTLLTLANNKFIKNVLLVSPGVSRKNSYPAFETVLYMTHCRLTSTFDSASTFTTTA